jgi:hypothetical protein
MNTKSVLPKLGLACVATFYFARCAWNPQQWRFIDGVNLLIHEAGHVIFMPFGDFLGMAGGTLLQVIVPALFVGEFYRQDQPYSASIALFWLGESLLNVSVYAADAIAMDLPLFGGPEAIHDWNFLLTRLGVIHATPVIAGTIRIIGSLIIAGAALFGVRNSFRNQSP